ncbi:MAG: hypothetical protein JOZ62_11255 [Acidobacteriaceae bacterium]|nr:hypothetical protein [Acidobacteriaceae bacterium]
MSTETRAEQRQAILAILVSLVACVAVSSENLIFGVSAAAGNVTLALSFWAIFAFSLHLTGLRLERSPRVRRWQALVVLCVTALSAWGLVLPHAKPLVRTVAAFAPGCLLAGLLFGPWRGLLPASKAAREKRVVKEKKNLDE